MQDMEEIDKEDAARDEEADNFESHFNFRFEEKNSAYLTTHTRETPEESIRRKDDKRKKEREAKKERLLEQKERKKQEIEVLKKVKKDEILEKLKKAEFLSGAFVDSKLVQKVQKELQTDFIPDVYDRSMIDVYDQKYYNKDDKSKVNDPTITKKVLKDNFDEIDS